MFDLRKIFAVPKDFLKSKIYCIIMAHVQYSNTHLIFREVQYTNFKFVTENANANQSRTPNSAGREDIALWTKIAEKVVNVEKTIHGLLLQSLGKLLCLINFMLIAQTDSLVYCMQAIITCSRL